MNPSELLGQLATVVCAHGETRNHPVRVGLDGIDGAGKSTLAELLAEELRLRLKQRVVVVSLDDFKHEPRRRYRQGSASPVGYYEDAFDVVSVRRGLLEPLGCERPTRVLTSTFDAARNRKALRYIDSVESDAVFIIEGVFLGRAEWRELWDLWIYLDVPLNVGRDRSMSRDAQLFGSRELAATRYDTRYAPAQQEYQWNSRPLDGADVIVEADADGPKAMRVQLHH